MPTDCSGYDDVFADADPDAHCHYDADGDDNNHDTNISEHLCVDGKDRFRSSCSLLNIFGMPFYTNVASVMSASPSDAVVPMHTVKGS